MARKKTWQITGLRVGMWWPGVTVVQIWAYLPKDGNRPLEARLTLAQARELCDDLGAWLRAAEKGDQD